MFKIVSTFEKKYKILQKCFQFFTFTKKKQ